VNQSNNTLGRPERFAHSPGRSLTRAFRAMGGASQRAGAWFPEALGRMAKLFILLVVVSGALSSTMFLERSSQIALLKAFLVFVLSLIPGWLYLQFIATKAPRLYDEYVLNLFRLKVDKLSNLPKPPPGSTYWAKWKDAREADGVRGDVSRNVYLQKFESVYGVRAVSQSRRDIKQEIDNSPNATGLVKSIKEETFSPVIVTTVLMAVGWIMFLQPEIYRQVTFFQPGTLSGLPEVAADPLRFGFLGAYTFILQSFVRRYYSSDLKTRAFVSAMLRVILVAALVFVIHPIWAFYGWSEELEVAFAFVVGYFPDAAFRLIKTKALGAAGILHVGSDEERFPLGELDGLNLWYEARLVEEGVENLQNLSTTSLVDLMISTRTPVARLTDWIDQSYLYLRVVDREHRDKLRALGIRSATDLIRVFDCSKKEDPNFHALLTRVLNLQGQTDDKGASRIEGIRYSLESEVNLIHVRHYRSHEWLDPPALIC
jgi:hypothetical protein